MGNSLFISQNVPNEQVKKYGLSQAANNFCLHINELMYFSKHIAVPPANVDNTFVNNTEKNTNIEYHLCRYFNHKGLGKLLNVLLDNIWLYFKVLKAHEKNIWFYNIWTGNILAYILIYIFSNKKVYILLADYNPNRYNGITRFVLLWSIKKALGVISLSGRCNEVNHNFMSIPGIIPRHKIRTGICTLSNNNTFLLSGTLNKNTGFGLALNIFKRIPNATLVLSGFVDNDYKSELEDICNKYKNIIYKGFINKYSDYLDLLSSVDFILSLRDPKSPVNQYNFPSKILESLAYNKVVISTIEYPELDGVNYLIAPFNEDALYNYIKQIIDKKIKLCLNNSDILINKYSEKAWKDAFTKMEKNQNSKTL